MPVTDMGRSAVPGRGAAAKGEGSGVSAALGDAGLHREGGRVRDGAQRLARRPPPKFRRKEGVAGGDGIGAELKELGSALRDASLGWTSGIQRVIPGGAPTASARQSHYFVLFSTAAAAQAYKDNIARLHYLSRKWTPTCATSRMAPVPGVLVDGEDVAALVSAFTIVPSSQKLLFSKVVKKPYRPAVARMIETGGYHPLITPEAGRQGENLVLVGLDRGKMNAFELGLAIGLDGKERNLQWRLEGGKEDIVLLGSKSDPKVAQGEQDEDEEEGWDSEGGGLGGRRGLLSSSRIVLRRDGEALERLAKAGVGEQAQVSAEVLW
ncbi:hypothetical protein VE04_00761 [Pseudogymnoascus sp. 24MN13]|nr:hypothetical protein VE04_00761 [Pseudogymnoascus sp. 24MN13]